METIPLYNIASAASALSVSFAIVGLIVAAICIFFPRANSVSTKLLGGLMVLALAFAANNGFVYSLAIFIIATLVTDLDFLEKIAALFWNRDKYWEYRKGQATLSEVKARVTNEAKEEVEPEKASGGAVTQERGPEEKRFDLKKYVEDALSFEKAVQDSLIAGKGPFSFATISTNLKLQSSFGVNVIDAVIETPTQDFVVEIKYSKRPHVLVNALQSVQRGLTAYRAYLNERHIVKEVIPIAIVPMEANGPSLYKGILPVLKYDSTKNEFVNQDEFSDALRNVSL